EAAREQQHAPVARRERVPLEEQRFDHAPCTERVAVRSRSLSNDSRMPSRAAAWRSESRALLPVATVGLKRTLTVPSRYSSAVIASSPLGPSACASRASIGTKSSGPARPLCARKAATL